MNAPAGPGAHDTGRLFFRTALAAAWPRLPAYLIHFVTNRCNGHCAFCFNRIHSENPVSELSIIEVDRIAAHWPGLIHVTLTGGEPFLRDDFIDLASAWLRHGVASMTIASNGSLPDRMVPAVETLLSRFPGVFFDLHLSFDGDAVLHDRLRGVPGLHDRVMDVARRLSPLQARRGFRLGATVTLSALNQDAAEETLRGLQTSNLFRRVQVLLTRGNPFDARARDCDPAVYDRCLEILRAPSAGGSRVRDALSRLVRDGVSATARGAKPRAACLAGRTMITMDPYGQLVPCEMLPQLHREGVAAAGIANWSLGNICEYEYDIRRVYESENAGKIRKWIRESGCACTFECALYNGLVFDPRAWPRVLGEIIRGR